MPKPVKKTCPCGYWVVASRTVADQQFAKHLASNPRHLSWIERTKAESSIIDHPAYYGGASNPYEAIKVIEAWDLGFCLGNAVKYISRAGKKDATKHVEDLEKARWYLDREIANQKDPKTKPCK